ncbi:MAG: DapH/DapD/GlmU-related protein [Anaerovoracaceae bacterium]
MNHKIINTYEEVVLEERKRVEKNLEYSKEGVYFVDIKQVYIEGKVSIGKGTVIYPCTVIKGDVTIGENCLIGQNTRIENSKIEDNVEIQSSVILESEIGEETKVGPFAYLRPNSRVGKKCKVGDFVEIKNSNFGNGSKVSHLTYIGDADVGENVNLGCGVVFVNYDGKNKYRTTVEDGAFVGCNTNLVSPVTVERESYIAAGSTVTTDVPEGSLYVSRSKAKVIKDWVQRKGLIKRTSKGGKDE